MSNLLARLLAVDPPGGDEHRTRWCRNPDGAEAADRIKALEAEVERYHAQIAALGARQLNAREALEVAEDAVRTRCYRGAREGVHAFAHGMRLALDALDEAERRYEVILSTLDMADALDDATKQAQP